MTRPTPHPAVLPTRPYFTRAEILERFDLTSELLGSLIRRGKFPRPDLVLSLKNVRWRRATIERFEAEGAHVVS